MYALIDCNNFYASCERVFQPKFNGKPVAILSNNDGCVISRSNEAKAVGIPMGAPAFQIKELVKEKNVKESAIKFELFTSSTQEKTISASVDGHTTITVLVDDEETTFEMSAKQTLLEATLKQGIDAPYSCQGGICSSCLCRITEGTAEMKKNSILSEDEIAEGLILSCQAYPTSATLRVDFDDV